MLLSIRKIFNHLKFALIVIGVGTTLLMLQLVHVTDYSHRLNELKNQHLLIEKIIRTDTTDPQMGAIVINGAAAEIDLSVKLSTEPTLFESFSTISDETTQLTLALTSAAKTFQNHSIAWASDIKGKESDQKHTQMLNSQTPYLAQIDKAIDYNIQLINEAVNTAKILAIIVFLLALVTYIRYRQRLNQIYNDIDKACSIDTNGEPKTVLTQEIDFILKRLLRRSAQPSTNSSLQNPLSGLNNQKGLLTAFNAKKSSRASNTIFLGVFEIDQYTSLINTLSKEDISNLFKKLGEIFSLYEQPLDVLSHLEDDHIVFVMSRNSKQIALEDCEKILHTVEASGFITAKGVIKITLSGGFLLKIPVKSLDEGIEDALKLIAKAKENGGNRIAQLRERADSFH
jgi:GGDEF domain-containing protein